MEKILSGLVVIVLGVIGLMAYFYATNLFVDRVFADQVNERREVLKSNAKLRESIRPWFFLAPALFLLALFLVYPAVRTFYLSFFDANSRNFVGLDNYSWALRDRDFGISVRNNVAWLVVVPFASTALGLIVAVLADRVRWESVAKSLIFMPMAISFVGAATIWRFVYAYRQAGQDQIGVLNAVVVGLGGEPQTWYTVPPLNNFALMVILIWIQTGFAMVLLSAALKGVPDELLEAARIDGANEFQIFFRILVPQIMGTVVVVMTTIIIVVLKVFDVVFTMTNGQFQTEVLANYMYRWMFRNFDYGRGSMIAVAIMVAIIPIMVWNIKRFREEERMR